MEQGGEESFAMSDSVLTEGLKTLSALLEKHYGRKKQRRMMLAAEQK